MKFANKKIWIVTIITLVLIELCSLFLMYKSANTKNIKLENVSLKENINNNNMFAILLEQEDGTYIQSNSNTWPSDYSYNASKSGCMDSTGAMIEGALTFDSTTNIATVETGETTNCYLYFDKVKPSLSETVIAIAGEEPDEYTGVYQVMHTNGLTYLSLDSKTEFVKLSKDEYVGMTEDWHEFDGEKWNFIPDDAMPGCYDAYFSIKESGFYQLTFFTKYYSDTYETADYEITGASYPAPSGTIQYNFESRYLYGDGLSGEESKTIVYYLEAGTNVTVYPGLYSSEAYFYLEKAISNISWENQVSFDAGYRYHENRGYVKFNGDLWQIVSVENGSEIGLNSGEYYTKIVSKNSIGNLAYDTNSGVDWPSSSLYATLNGDYYNKSGNYSDIGLSDDAKEMIASANWYYSSIDSNAYWLDEFFIRERMDESKFVNNYVGIMYPTDAPYNAAIPELGSCATLSLSSIASSCMKGFIPHNNMWLITPGNTGAYQYDNVGDVKETSTNTELAIYPVVYLDSSVYITSGSGLSGDPYIIKK